MCKYTNTTSYMYYLNEQKYVTMQLKMKAMQKYIRLLR
jgi:hypothetical protein